MRPVAGGALRDMCASLCDPMLVVDERRLVSRRIQERRGCGLWCTGGSSREQEEGSCFRFHFCRGREKTPGCGADRVSFSRQGRDLVREATRQNRWHIGTVVNSTPRVCKYERLQTLCKVHR